MTQDYYGTKRITAWEAENPGDPTDDGYMELPDGELR